MRKKKKFITDIMTDLRPVRTGISLTGFTPLKTIMRQAKDMVSLTGFTFIELMLVVMLIAVLTVLSVPRISSVYSRLEIYNFVRKTAALMRYAQSKAIAETEKIYLIIYQKQPDDKAGSLYLAKGDKDNLNKPAQKITEERLKLAVPLRTNIALNPKNGNNKIIFNPDGSIYGPAITVYNNERKFNISAGGGIGRIEVKEVDD